MPDDADLQHFLHLARQGARNPGASTYELEDLFAFLNLAKHEPETARDLLEGEIS